MSKIVKLANKCKYLTESNEQLVSENFRLGERAAVGFHELTPRWQIKDEMVEKYGFNQIRGSIAFQMKLCDKVDKLAEVLKET